MKYIQRRRLEKCASQLSNPMWCGHTISEIAFSWGFNSSAHFTRAFRAHFGVTPREYRAQTRLIGDAAHATA
jgi:AraC-like DNA-binding protein